MTAFISTTIYTHSDDINPCVVILRFGRGWEEGNTQYFPSRTFL